MFITNNHATFHLWWKENLVKYWKVSKYYVHDCRWARLCYYFGSDKCSNSYFWSILSFFSPISYYFWPILSFRDKHSTHFQVLCEKVCATGKAYWMLRVVLDRIVIGQQCYPPSFHKTEILIRARVLYFIS